MKKLIIIALLASVSPFIQAHNYETLERFLLPNLPVTKEKGSCISQYDKHRTALTILRTAAENEPPKTISQVDINEHVIEDLNLLFYDQSNPTFTVLEKIRRTQTTLGTCYLGHMLLSPLTDVAELTQRQHIIQHLAANDDLLTSLRNIIERFAPYEDQLLSLWNPEDRLYGKNMRQSFFGGAFKSTLSRDAASLELSNRYDDFATIMGAFVGLVITSFIQKLTNTQDSGWITYPKYFFTAAGFAFGISNMVNNLNSRQDLLRLARQRLSSLVELGTTMKNVTSWGSEHQESAALMSPIRTINRFTARENIKIRSFLNSLQSSAFNIGNGYWTSLMGPVLKAIPSFLNKKTDLCPALSALAEIDALVSIATLYKEHQDTPQVYSFPDYLPAHNGPQLNTSEFWHPMLPADKAVASSLALGSQDATRNIVITGPNTAGKSTVSKAIVLSALFAQTLTIVPATTQSITPFYVFNTYLNIVSDIGGISQHRAEVRRAIEIIESISNLPQDKFALSIMDEMFRMTFPHIGATAAYAIGAVLGENKNSLLLLATHYAKLTTLAERPESDFANYRVCAIENGDGSFTFPYTLEPGINSKVIALDLLAYEGFNPEILDYAYEHLDRIEGISEPGAQQSALVSFINELRDKVENQATRIRTKMDRNTTEDKSSLVSSEIAEPVSEDQIPSETHGK